MDLEEDCIFVVEDKCRSNQDSSGLQAVGQAIEIAGFRRYVRSNDNVLQLLITDAKVSKRCGCVYLTFVDLLPLGTEG